MGVQPATYFLKHMSDTELVMKFHGLGPHGMKAMAQSIEVRYNYSYEVIKCIQIFKFLQGTTNKQMKWQTRKDI